MSIVLNGTTGITAPAATIAGALSGSPVQGGLVSSTAVTASGTSVDFTGIPSWVKRITVMFSGVSTNGSSPIKFRLGTSSGVETTGYLGYTSMLGSTSLSAASNFTSGFDLAAASGNAVRHGKAEFVKIDNNTWAANGFFGRSDIVSAEIFAGSKALSDVLTQISVTTNNGTDTFDAGTINIMYEG